MSLILRKTGNQNRSSPPPQPPPPSPCVQQSVPQWKEHRCLLTDLNDNHSCAKDTHGGRSHLPEPLLPSLSNVVVCRFRVTVRGKVQ